MPNWGAALEALGQGLMRLPEFQQRQQEFQREKDLWKTEDALNAQRLQREQRALDLAAEDNSRRRQQFDWDQSDKVAGNTRIGGELFLDDPLWNIIAKGPGKTSFEPIRGNAVADDPLKGEIPVLPTTAPGQTVGLNAPIGEVTGMRRVPNFTEGQMIQQTRAAQDAAYRAGLLRQGDERLDQGSRALDIRESQGEAGLELRKRQLALAHQRMTDARQRGDASAAQRAAVDIAQLSLGLANLAGRNTTATANRFTGEVDPAQASQRDALMDVVKSLINRIPQGAVTAAPTGPPTSPPSTAVTPEPDIMNADPATVRRMAARYKADIAKNPALRDPSAELAFKLKAAELTNAAK